MWILFVCFGLLALASVYWTRDLLADWWEVLGTPMEEPKPRRNRFRH